MHDTAKPCPFCGTSMVNVYVGSALDRRVVECVHCGAKGPEVFHERFWPDQEAVEKKSTEEAIAAWNERN